VSEPEIKGAHGTFVTDEGKQWGKVSGKKKVKTRIEAFFDLLLVQSKKETLSAVAAGENV